MTAHTLTNRIPLTVDVPRGEAIDASDAAAMVAVLAGFWLGFGGARLPEYASDSVKV
jgi:hypothetical protein